MNHQFMRLRTSLVSDARPPRPRVLQNLPPDLADLVFGIIERDDVMGGVPTLELPELRPKIQFFLGDPYLFTSGAGRIGQAPRIGIFGTQTVPAHSLPGRHVRVLILDLYPAALEILGLGRMRSFKNAAVALESLIGPRADDWFEEVASAATFEARCVSCIAWLRRLRCSRTNDDQRMQSAFRSVMNGVCDGPDQLATHLDLSVRTLRRHFSEQFGLSPKFAMRLGRFNRALVALHPGPWDASPKMPDPRIAFHDQSHFIKDFRSFADGVTPAAYAKAKRVSGDALVTTLLPLDV